MSFIDPQLLESLGVYDTSTTIENVDQRVIASTPSGSINPNMAGRALLAAILTRFGIATPETLAHVNDLVQQAGTDNNLASQLLDAELYDPGSVIGRIVNEKYPEIQLAKQAGLQGPPLNVGSVLKQRGDLAEVMQQAGLPPGFYDTPDDFTNLIVKGVTPDLLRARVNDGFKRVANADPAIRDEFAKYFGPSGDNALAAYFLDPAKAQPILDQQVNAAVMGGVGGQFGFNIDRNRAIDIGAHGFTETQARAAFSNLQHLSPLFNESISETQDLTAEGAGVDAQFNLGGSAQTDLEHRLDERKAAFAGGGGAAVSSSQSGFGSARSR